MRGVRPAAPQRRGGLGEAGDFGPGDDMSRPALGEARRCCGARGLTALAGAGLQRLPEAARLLSVERVICATAGPSDGARGSWEARFDAVSRPCPESLRPCALTRCTPDPRRAPRQVRTLKAEKAWLESQMRQRAAEASPARPPLVRRLSA